MSSESNQNPSDASTSTNAALFTFKSRKCKIIECFQWYWFRSVAVLVSLIGSMWLLAEIADRLGLPVFGDTWWIISVTCLFVLSVMAWAWRSYVLYVPREFADESSIAQRLAHLQPLHWEVDLCLELLNDRLVRLDGEYDAIQSGARFVSRDCRFEDFGEYNRWVSVRIADLTAMLVPFNELVIQSFVKSIFAEVDANLKANSIRNAVVRVADYYSQIIEFERDAKRSMPPVEMEELYDLQMGWSAPIREGIAEVRELLGKIRGVNPRSEGTQIDHMIHLRTPDELSRFMDRMGGRIE